MKSLDELAGKRFNRLSYEERSKIIQATLKQIWDCLSENNYGEYITEEKRKVIIRRGIAKKNITIFDPNALETDFGPEGRVELYVMENHIFGYMVLNKRLIDFSNYKPSNYYGVHADLNEYMFLIDIWGDIKNLELINAIEPEVIPKEELGEIKLRKKIKGFSKFEFEDDNIRIEFLAIEPNKMKILDKQR